LKLIIEKTFLNINLKKRIKKIHLFPKKKKKIK
jgi:hypothetical protein